MTPEAQQIAIAKACGLLCRQGHIWAAPTNYTGPLHALDGDVIPDYLNDLNAMHEAEKVLTVGQMQRANYIDQLQIVVGTEGLHSYSAYTATAAQRAEAFLRTLGLWDDSGG